MLDIIPSKDCDEHGVPLDWRQCRECDGAGGERLVLADMTKRPCPTCAGHGSLRARALAEHEPRLRDGWRDLLWQERNARGETFSETKIPTGDRIAALDHIEAHMRDSNRWYEEAEASFVHRCEGCWHPMAEGSWEGPAAELLDGAHHEPDRIIAEVLAARARWLSGGDLGVTYNLTHYSPCDDRCRHAGRGRWGGPPQLWAYADLGANAEGEVAYSVLDDRIDHGHPVEAAWRPVDIRPLDWAHDLRPQSLRLLCLHCWAARS